MNCRQTSELLQAYAQSSLDNERSIQVKKHLDGCHSCSAELQSVKFLIEDLNSSTLLKAPKDFESKVMDSVMALNINKVYQNIRNTGQPAYSFIYRRLGISMIATAAILLLGLIYIPQSGLNGFNNKVNAGSVVVSERTAAISNGLGQVNYKVVGFVSSFDKTVNKILKEE